MGTRGRLSRPASAPALRRAAPGSRRLDTNLVGRSGRGGRSGNTLGHGRYANRCENGKDTLMQRQFKLALSGVLAPALLLTASSIPAGAAPGAGSSSPLVSQGLDYTENPVDVPNPDRGFYRANDGMVVPVNGAGPGTVNVGTSPVTVGGAVVNTRVSHIYFDRGTSRTTPSRPAARDIPQTIGRLPGSRSHEAGRLGAVQLCDALRLLAGKRPAHVAARHVSTLDPGRARVHQGQAGSAERQRSHPGPLRLQRPARGYSWVDVEHPEDGYMDRPVADIEPDKATLLGHIAQLKPILHENEDVMVNRAAGCSARGARCIRRPSGRVRRNTYRN